MSKVREATIADLPLVETFARQLSAETVYSFMDCNVDHLQSVLRDMIELDNCTWLIAETTEPVGAIVGTVVPHWYSGSLVAQTLFLIVRQDHRNAMHGVRLLKAFESWAQHHGATYMIMGTSSGYEIEKLQHLYERLGYRSIGNVFSKYV